MFFTREDIEKIHQGLLKLGIKDSELPETINVNSDDTLAVVQDGKNKKINIEEFFNNISLFKKEGFINITDRFNKHSISLIEAIQTVPTHQRIDGLVITFEDINEDWRIYQFRGDAVDFFDEKKWTDLYDYTNYIVKSIIPDEEDLTVSKPDKNGNAIVSLKDRVYDESNFSGKGYKILRKNIQTIDGVRKNVLTQNMINKPNTIYEIRYDFDLNGKGIEIKEGCVLNFVGGSFNNGSIYLNNTVFTGDYGTRLNVILRGTNITKDFLIYHSTNDIDTSKLATSTKGSIIMDDINIVSNINLLSDIKGINKSVNVNIAEDLNFIRVVGSNITISNITLTKKIKVNNTGYIDGRECLRMYSSNSDFSGFRIDNSIINGGVSFYNDKEIDINNIYIINSVINADFSNILDLEDKNPQKDVITIYGCTEVFIMNNIINAKNINRIFKSTAIIKDGDYSNQFHNPSNIYILNNFITSDSSKGKQVYDMYCGTQNVFIKNNKFHIRGHSNIIENKTSISNGNRNIISIEDNYIDCDSRVGWYDLTSNDLVIYRNNNIHIEGNSINDSIIDFRGCDFDFISNTINIVEDCTVNTLSASESRQDKTDINQARVIDNIFINSSTVIGVNGVKSLLFQDNNITSFTNSFPEIYLHKGNDLSIIYRKTIYNSLLKPIFLVLDIDTSNFKINIDIKNRNQLFSRVGSNNEEIKKSWLKCINSTFPIYSYKSTNAQYFLKDSYKNLDAIKEFNITSGYYKVFIDDLGYYLYNIGGKWVSFDGFSNSLRKGEISSIPSSLNKEDKGTPYFDFTSNRQIFWQGSKWVDSNGNDANFARYGLFNDKPSNPKIGFSYFCTDKQTSEGNNNGIMIYYKGDNVWVDSLGRVVV